MKKLLLSVVALAVITTASAQKLEAPQIALKSNLLSLPLGSINLGSEMRLAEHWTLGADLTLTLYNFYGDVPYGNNNLEDPTLPEDLTGFYANGWSGFVEARYYFKQALSGHHLGFYAMGARYGKVQVADCCIWGYATSGGLQERATNAHVASLGLTYGYSFKFGSSERYYWGLDLYIGGGLLYATYYPGLAYDLIELGETSRKEVFSWTLLKTGIALSYTF